MRTLSHLRGFSLIELMVVIAILALMLSGAFAAFGPARSKGYDARRLSDLKTVQGILESYFVRCGRYPGTETCGDTAPGDWSSLITTLRGSKINATTIPSDPGRGQKYEYYVSTNGLHYVLKAVLENPNEEAMKGSLSTDDTKTLIGNNGVVCGGSGGVTSTTTNESKDYCVGL